MPKPKFLTLASPPDVITRVYSLSRTSATVAAILLSSESVSVTVSLLNSGADFTIANSRSKLSASTSFINVTLPLSPFAVIVTPLSSLLTLAFSDRKNFSAASILFSFLVFTHGTVYTTLAPPAINSSVSVSFVGAIGVNRSPALYVFSPFPSVTFTVAATRFASPLA